MRGNELDERERALVDSVAKGDGRVRCKTCGSRTLVSRGIAGRYLGDVRYELVCTNQDAEHPEGRENYMEMSPDAARQFGLPIPPYRQ